MYILHLQLFIWCFCPKLFTDEVHSKPHLILITCMFSSKFQHKRQKVAGTWSYTLMYSKLECFFFWEREYVRWVGTLWRVPSFGLVTRSIAKVAWSVGLEISCLTVAVGLVVVLLQILVNEKAHKPEWWSSGRWVPCKWPLCRQPFVTLTL